MRQIAGLLFLILSVPGTLWSQSPDPADLQARLDSAQPGAHIELPAGRYTGNFTINKPLHLSGRPEEVTLDGAGVGTVLKINAANVRVEGLTIVNSGEQVGGENAGVHADHAPALELKNLTLENVLFGLRIMASPDSKISGCSIRGKDRGPGRRGDGIKIWFSPGTAVLNSSIHGVRDILIWYSDNSLIEGNHIAHNRYGLHYMYSHHNTARNNTIESNSVGIYDMYSNDLTIRDNLIMKNRGASGYGFAAKESNRLSVINNRIVNNRIGIHVDNSPIEEPQKEAEITRFAHNLIAYNDVGVGFVGPGEWTLFTQNDFRENWRQVQSTGVSHLIGSWQQNYWSDYQGFDLESDGIGSIPYRSVDVVDELVERNNGTQLFRYSPIMIALSFANRAFPWLQSEPRFVDTEPSMHPLRTIEENERGKGSPAVAIASLLLLGLSTVVMRVCAL